MRTLYIRNVPDGVVERLERLAKQDGMSVNALAVRQLTQFAQRADNASLLASLPDLDIDLSRIAADVEAGRAER